MRKLLFALAAGVIFAGAASVSASTPGADAAANAAAVANAARPAADSARDGDRKPLEMLALAGVHPGMKIAELLPGAGYFTRIFSMAVGPTGKVFAIISAQPSANPPPVAAIAAEPAYGNVTVIPAPFTELPVPEPVDLVWTSQNYHDLHLARLNLDVAAVNKAVFNALKPGGLYVIVDHSAVSGAPVTVADTLHRIDQAIVRREVEAAGFVFVSESDALRNAADDRSKLVFDPAIRGHTDQFVMVFRKPG